MTLKQAIKEAKRRERLMGYTAWYVVPWNDSYCFKTDKDMERHPFSDFVFKTEKKIRDNIKTCSHCGGHGFVFIK